MKDGFLGARRGQDLRVGVQRYVKTKVCPSGDGLPHAALADDGRVLRDGVERVDECLADERWGWLDRVADAEVEDRQAAAREVFLGLIEDHREIRRGRGRHRVM